MVGVDQLADPLTVNKKVAGSSPVVHPIFHDERRLIGRLPRAALGGVGSNPAAHPNFGRLPEWSKGEVCKTFIRGFESRTGFQTPPKKT